MNGRTIEASCLVPHLCQIDGPTFFPFLSVDRDAKLQTPNYTHPKDKGWQTMVRDTLKCIGRDSGLYTCQDIEVYERR